MHFYDLTEEKHREINKELQERQRVKHAGDSPAGASSAGEAEPAAGEVTV